MLLPGAPSRKRCSATIERHRRRVLFGLPTCTTRCRAPGRGARDLSSLRLCVSAAETLSQEMFAEWQRRYGLRIVEGLGSTEVLHIYLSNRADRQRPGASGARVPGYEMKLVRPGRTRSRTASPASCGCAATRRRPCYWNRPDKTRETMRDGWIYTGDRFRSDADGFHFFRGPGGRPGKGKRPVGASDRGRALPRGASDGARMRGARGRGRKPADDAAGVRRAAAGPRARTPRRRTSATGLRQARHLRHTSIRVRSNISKSCQRPARTRSIGSDFEQWVKGDGNYLKLTTPSRFACHPNQIMGQVWGGRGAAQVIEDRLDFRTVPLRGCR